METIKSQDVTDGTEAVKTCAQMHSEDSERPAKRRRLDEEFAPPSLESRAHSRVEEKAFPSLYDWPDDIIIHLLQFLDLETLENFDGTCKRIHFFVRCSLKRFLEPVITSIPLSDDIQYLIQARS